VRPLRPPPPGSPPEIPTPIPPRAAAAAALRSFPTPLGHTAALHSIFLLFPHSHHRTLTHTRSEGHVLAAILLRRCRRRLGLLCVVVGSAVLQFYSSAVWLGFSLAHLERCEVGAWISTRREFRTRDHHFSPKTSSRECRPTTNLYHIISYRVASIGRFWNTLELGNEGLRKQHGSELKIYAI